ncbi:hypothetical protein BX616_005112 [Lobosporangium transversale]|nr:hypothetical protein BX616_005112 [Lobosporangium transversale]
MASILVVDFFLQIASGSLISDSPEGDGDQDDFKDIDSNPRTIFSIVQIIAIVATICLYSLFIYPNTFRDGYCCICTCLQKRKDDVPSSLFPPILSSSATITSTPTPEQEIGARAKYKRRENQRIWITLMLASVYLFFVVQTAYDIWRFEGTDGVIGWVTLFLNLVMVMLLAFDCRLQCQNQQRYDLQWQQQQQQQQQQHRIQMDQGDLQNHYRHGYQLQHRHPHYPLTELCASVGGDASRADTTIGDLPRYEPTINSNNDERNNGSGSDNSRSGRGSNGEH